MPRKKSPDAKDITMSARFSKTEAAEIDGLRGTVDRSVWLRSAALAVLAANRPRPVRPGAAGEPGQALSLGAEEPPPPRNRNNKPAPCPHRIRPGSYCKTCGRIV